MKSIFFLDLLCEFLQRKYILSVKNPVAAIADQVRMWIGFESIEMAVLTQVDLQYLSGVSQQRKGLIYGCKAYGGKLSSKTLIQLDCVGVPFGSGHQPY
jgi:hypothetical protein